MSQKTTMMLEKKHKTGLYLSYANGKCENLALYFGFANNSL